MLTLAAGGNAQVMLDLLVILATAAGVSMVVARLRIAPIAGYLIAGAIFGPNAFGVISDSASIASISQIAIVLLMFGIGLHLDPSDLRRGMLPTLGIGVISTLITVALGTPIAMAFSLPFPAAVAVASAIAMSSTAVVLRTLQQRRQLRHVHGQIAFGTLIAQDMAVVIVLAMIPVLAGIGAAGTADEGGFDLVAMLGRAGLAVGAIALMVLFGIKVLPRLVAEATRDSGSELLLVLSAAIGLGAAVLTAYLDLSPELGAFLAGFLLAGTPVRFQLSGQIGPMRDLFMAVFFTAVGLTLDIGAAAASWWVVILALALTAAVKTLSIGVSAWVLGASPAMALASGVILFQAGEFTLVVLGVAAASGLFGEQVGTVESVLIAVVFLSLLLTPPVMARAEQWGAKLSGWRLAPWLRRSPFTSRAHPAEGGRFAVVAGYGPVGRAVADRFEHQGVHVTIIELNRKTVDRQRQLGRRIIYGDVTNPEVLVSADVGHAEAVVITVPDDDVMLRACRTIRSMNPQAFIAARTNYLSKAFLARELGANHVIVEELATAEAMASQVLSSCFVDPDHRQDAPGSVAGEPAPPVPFEPAPTEPSSPAENGNGAEAGSDR